MRTASSSFPRTWFITGASRGLGHAFALAALERGDQVVAAARTISPNVFDARHADRLLALNLDVTDRAAVFTAVSDAIEHFGRLDIVVNNAGTMSAGMVEEFTEPEARAQFEVNVFGALWVSQAVLLTFATGATATSCKFPALPASAASQPQGCTAPASSPSKV
jgi:NAD(P)-dependent dehydrogenase (short-subunit alcohol dehydrogenase family)